MKFKSAREMIKAMDDGDIPRQHLGPKNFHILKQELFSLKNEYNPNTSTGTELNEFYNKMAANLEEIQQLPTTEREQLLKEVDKMLDV